MSAAVICDRCGRVVKQDDAIHIDYLFVGTRGKVGPIYGGDLCHECKTKVKFEYAGMELFATVPAIEESEVTK